MPKSKRITVDDNFALSRLKNVNNAAEGTNLLPPQVGQFRIPFVTSLKLVRTEFIDGQTYFTLTWDNVALNNVSHYAIYVNDSTNPSNAPIGPYLAQRSPSRIAIPSPPNVPLIFRLQTSLKNGFQSDLDSSPTCTGITLS